MNTVLRKFGICAFLILIVGTVVVAKDWRGIIPLKSTRADVERVFGAKYDFSISREGS